MESVGQCILFSMILTGSFEIEGDQDSRTDR